MLIDYKKVNIYQKDGIKVLNDIDFTVDEGQFIYIIGKVGSGKSSLLKTIYAELEIGDAEKAFVLNRDMISLKRKNVPSLRKELGIVFQDFQLLPDCTVFHNLSFVLKSTGWKKNQIIGRIDEVLNDVGLLDKKEKYPHEMSGGEQKRIAIARALLNSPGNLDSETSNGIMMLLHKLSNSGTSIVMSTHNIPLLDRFPGVVYCCHDGIFEEVTNDFNKNNYKI